MTDLSLALEYIPLAIISIIAISNPISTATMFNVLTEKMSEERKHQTAVKASRFSLYILVFFALTGMLIFQIFGFGIGAFRIAGGILLTITAIDMLHPKPEGLTDNDGTRDISLIPMAIPFISGPGTIVTTVVLMSGAQDLGGGDTLVWLLASAGVLLGIVITIAVSYLGMTESERVFRFLGEGGEKALSKLMGLIVLAIAIQFIINGIGDVLPDLVRKGMEAL
ncbi:MarC family protein [Methanomassiliicoccus luminyensis]|jgi:multiple antibiotic resistance protein|uniref:MarC family protein n=1 Tax=Methanomassiliicoccus luminyensis TaxID=1080712 RepID=UPI0003653E61|nr:MarC family protein [Methanomassiliicoccus luminyensis]